MTVAWVSQLYCAMMAPSTANSYGNATIGILMIPILQILVVPIQMAFDSCQIDLPASILVMILVTTAMIILNCFNSGVSSLYSSHLKGPTNFLGRHMSFGFVAAFVMLSKNHITNAADVPRIAGAFAVTTLLNYVGSFLFAAGGYRLEENVRGLRKRAKDIEEKGDHSRSSSRFVVRVSPASNLTTTTVDNRSLSSLNTSCASSATVDFIIQTAPLWVSVFLIITVGIPIYYITGYDMPFETFCFVFLWIASVRSQRSIKSCILLELHPSMRSFLATIVNPVLVTSALGTAYFWTKTAVTQRDIVNILGSFRHHESWAKIMTELGKGGSFAQNIGAGDLASALLDAGIVSLGFKMFEYRRELWNSFTTVFSTCLVLAVINVFLNVVFARAMGLQAAEALAFCARNVTIALGVPAIQKLDGSTTLVSALVTFSGMLFQMSGEYIFSWLRIHDRARPTTLSAMSDSDKGTDEEEDSKCKIIAAGITVGINAAAMGTAHLIERDSRCTAYSALSMTFFGAFTVALTAVPAIADALKALAAR